MGARQRPVTHAHIQRPSEMIALMAHAHIQRPSSIFAQRQRLMAHTQQRPIVHAHHHMGTLQRPVSHVYIQRPSQS
jgi:hypothetical protein